MAKVQATMSTEIALDTLQAANSIKRLTQLVNKLYQRLEGSRKSNA